MTSTHLRELTGVTEICERRSQGCAFCYAFAKFGQTKQNCGPIHYRAGKLFNCDDASPDAAIGFARRRSNLRVLACKHGLDFGGMTVHPFPPNRTELSTIPWPAIIGFSIAALFMAGVTTRRQNGTQPLTRLCKPRSSNATGVTLTRHPATKMEPFSRRTLCRPEPGPTSAALTRFRSTCLARLKTRLMVLPPATMQVVPTC